jgi:hypothetical protein
MPGDSPMCHSARYMLADLQQCGGGMMVLFSLETHHWYYGC